MKTQAAESHCPTNGLRVEGHTPSRQTALEIDMIAQV